MTTRKRHRCSESLSFRIVRFEPERSIWRTLLAGERLDLPKGDRHEPREGRPPLKSAVGECFTPRRGLPAQQGFRRGREWQHRVDLRRSRDAMAVARPVRMQASGPKAGPGGEAAGQAVPHRSTASGNSGHLEPSRPTTEISLEQTSSGARMPCKRLNQADNSSRPLPCLNGITFPPDRTRSR